ncbi:MAG: hypothetical protein AAGF12_08850 [Myxococcota bacterium]
MSRFHDRLALGTMLNHRRIHFAMLIALTPLVACEEVDPKDPQPPAPDASVTDAQPDGSAVDASKPTVCDPTPIFQQSCALAGCHDSETAVASLDLTTPGDGSQFLRAAASDGVCGDVGIPLIDPANPALSLMTVKLLDTVPCGTRMPLPSALSAGDIGCIEDWVGAVPAPSGR